MSLAVATRYANALADVVLSSKGAIDPQNILGQLRALESIIESSADLRNVLQSPAVATAKKGAVLSRIADSLAMDKLVRNFVFLVVRNRRGILLPQMRAAFEKVLDERSGMVKVDVTSAAAISPESRARLEAELARMTQKHVRCSYSVDAGLLGGAVARIGSLVYDGSVRGQLETLRRKLAAGLEA